MFRKNLPSLHLDLLKKPLFQGLLVRLKIKSHLKQNKLQAHNPQKDKKNQRPPGPSRSLQPHRALPIREVDLFFGCACDPTKSVCLKIGFPRSVFPCFFSSLFEDLFGFPMFQTKAQAPNCRCSVFWVYGQWVGRASQRESKLEGSGTWRSLLFLCYSLIVSK